MTRDAEFYEYGINCKGDTTEDDPHRSGMTRDEAVKWLDGWIEMGGKPDTFEIIRREIGPWETLREEV